MQDKREKKQTNKTTRAKYRSIFCWYLQTLSVVPAHGPAFGHTIYKQDSLVRHPTDSRSSASASGDPDFPSYYQQAKLHTHSVNI